jgi:hypothetical protein
MPKIWNEATKSLDEWPWEDELGKVHGPLSLASARSEPEPLGEQMDRVAARKAMEEFPKSPAAKLLDRAAKLVDGDRAISHGDRHTNFGMAADLWSAYRGAKFEPHHVAWMLVLLKISREANGTHNIDNAIDACGYAALAGELADQDHGC